MLFGCQPDLFSLAPFSEHTTFPQPAGVCTKQKRDFLHRNRDHLIKANPHLVGAEPGWFSEEEYALKSGDEIDVFFRSGHQWIGVEVKSCISDKLERDYERGLYQAIKYAAVLEAQAQVDHPGAPPIVKVFLALERTLPSHLRATAEKLGVSVLENISPSA